jgi:acid phosphatase
MNITIMKKAFERIFIIMFENESQDLVLENPYFKKLALQGCLLTNSHGVAHPSQPNYIATIGGDTLGITDDECHTINETNLVDLLEKKGVSWKAYMEDLPMHDKLCCVSENKLYWKKHNPFLSFKNNQHYSRLRHIVNEIEFQHDLENKNLPAFCWFTPNIQNDGHTIPDPECQDAGGSMCHVDFSANWLEGFLSPLLENPYFMDETLIVITYDENWPPNNENKKPIYNVLLGPMIDPGSTENAYYDHYSLLATIEYNFGLGSLNRNDQHAEIYNFLWNEIS